ncbi:MAG TPA: GNAT family protein [Candidatus Limnocylindria bacterium]|nr:GNAT family protein [Candidatus Limnocylindria bacterium]
MPLQTWFPEALTGDLVVLRRHAPENLEAFRRWYGDPDVARLTRYQDGPMRPDEIDRFFTARVIGLDSLTLAVHLRTSNRLIGSCAFSQLDGDNGSGLYHITIGEKDCWGQGYGTEATRLMLDHAFGALGLHRVGLTVFAFNERAIRSYRKVGFKVEGRAREAIWRDGRYWDEVAMSILESEWRAIRASRGVVEVDGGTTRGRGRANRRTAPAAEVPASGGAALAAEAPASGGAVPAAEGPASRGAAPAAEAPASRGAAPAAEAPASQGPALRSQA